MIGKKFVISVIIGTIAIFAIAVVGALRNTQTEFDVNGSDNKAEVAITKADKVEVFLFHATMRCPTCIAIGRFTGETVNERFQGEIKSGQVEFREINIDLPENKELAQKFQAGGSALYFNAIKDGADNIEQDTKVWSFIGNKTQFKDYIEDRINGLLGK